MKKFIFLLFICTSINLCAVETLEFEASDGLKITADLYLSHVKTAPFIILFHQAGWSRGEYHEIAPKLNALGFNCLAVDQRSGGEINNVPNETYKRAKEQSLGTTYVDAEIDINSAIDYVKKEYSEAERLIIWGSSYSSALVLRIGGLRGDVDAILSFAPGEYFESLGKPYDYIEQGAKKISVPVFITSMKDEKEAWWKIYKSISTDRKKYFIPESQGRHGSRALWERFPEHVNYWKAVKEFLKGI